MIRLQNFARKWKEVKDFIMQGMDKIHGNEKVWEGQFTTELENILIESSGKKFASACMSGSHAISISLMAHNLKWGAKVIIPSYSCPATVSSVQIVGCEPVFCEINEYGSMSIDRLQRLADTGAKAVLATGLYGDVHDHDPVEKFCKDNNMIYINDAAQSQFALYNGKNSLGLGDVVCMSFADNKPIPVAGTYGAMLTDNETIYKKSISLRHNGKTSKLAPFEMAGFSSQPEEEKAIQVLASWQHFDKWQARKLVISDYYNEQFKDKIVLRPSPEYSVWNGHKYVIMVADKFKAYNTMLEAGVETQQHYADNFATLPWTPTVTQTFPMTDKFVKQSLTLPNDPFMTDSEVEGVAETVLRKLQ